MTRMPSKVLGGRSMKTPETVNQSEILFNLYTHVFFTNMIIQHALFAIHIKRLTIE